MYFQSIKPAIVQNIADLHSTNCSLDSLLKCQNKMWRFEGDLFLKSLGPGLDCWGPSGPPKGRTGPPLKGGLGPSFNLLGGPSLNLRGGPSFNPLGGGPLLNLEGKPNLFGGPSLNFLGGPSLNGLGGPSVNLGGPLLNLGGGPLNSLFGPPLLLKMGALKSLGPFLNGLGPVLNGPGPFLNGVPLGFPDFCGLLKIGFLSVGFFFCPLTGNCGLENWGSENFGCSSNPGRTLRVVSGRLKSSAEKGTTSAGLWSSGRNGRWSLLPPLLYGFLENQTKPFIVNPPISRQKIKSGHNWIYQIWHHRKLRSAKYITEKIHHARKTMCIKY